MMRGKRERETVPKKKKRGREGERMTCGSRCHIADAGVAPRRLK
jgi:hypothetical protein